MTEKFYYEQKKYAKEYLIPHLLKYIPDLSRMKVLEVGCAEAGLLAEMKFIGAEVTGLEMNEKRVDVARKLNPGLDVIVGDITDDNICERLDSNYDLIIMREVIEHVPDKEKTFISLYKLLNADGFLFLSFPPKYSPFAGHQQVGSTILRLIPYIHLMPYKFLKFAVNIFNENKGFAEHLLLHYQRGMSISAFEYLSKKYGFKAIVKECFLFRPIYKLRYGLPIISIPGIPFLREFTSFGYEILLKKK